eukprot:g10553.t2
MKAVTAEDGEKRQCGKCHRRISLVESTIRCRCGLSFCERHMAAENHECKFDWRQMQREKIARENPKVTQSTSKMKSSKVAQLAPYMSSLMFDTSVEDWCDQYCKHHSVATVGERSSQVMHLMGVLLLVVFNLRGILHASMNAQVMLWIRQAVLGYFLGLLCAHALTRPQTVAILKDWWATGQWNGRLVPNRAASLRFSAKRAAETGGNSLLA